MFGLGFSEIVVLAILGLILLGPEQLPEVAKTLGRFIADLKRSTDELTDEFKKNGGLSSSENLLQEIRDGMKVEDQVIPSLEVTEQEINAGHKEGSHLQNAKQLEMDVDSNDNTENAGHGKKSDSDGSS